MKRTTLLSRIAAGTFATGIAAVHSFAAQPERPEITIRETTPKAAEAYVIAANVAHGYKLVAASPKGLIFSKPYPSSTTYAPGVKPQMVTSYTITLVGTSAEVIGSIGTKMVHERNGGSKVSESEVIDLTNSNAGNAGPELIAILQRIKNEALVRPLPKR
jgi:hypothetical protein